MTAAAHHRSFWSLVRHRETRPADPVINPCFTVQKTGATSARTLCAGAIARAQPEADGVVSAQYRILVHRSRGAGVRRTVLAPGRHDR